MTNEEAIARVEQARADKDELAKVPTQAETGGREYQSESFKTLKAWTHWVLKNPLDEEQENHAKATNDLFSLLGTRDAQLAKAQAALDEAAAIIESRDREISRLRQDWLTARSEIARLREVLDGVDCECTVAERLSGHRS